MEDSTPVLPPIPSLTCSLSAWNALHWHSEGHRERKNERHRGEGEKRDALPSHDSFISAAMTGSPWKQGGDGKVELRMILLDDFYIQQ